jgi:hypothetical protein
MFTENNYDSLPDAAEELRKCFVEKTRTADQSKYWCLSDDLTDEEQNEIRNYLIRNIHDGEMPNDIIYGLIVECIDAISEGLLEEDLEADYSNYDLYQWLNGTNKAAGFCDKVIIEYQPKSLTEILQIGQLNHKIEIFRQVCDFLDDYTNEE